MPRDRISPDRSRIRVGLKRPSEAPRHRNHSPILAPPRQRIRRSEVVPIRRPPRSPSPSAPRRNADKFSKWFCLGVFGMNYRTTENDLRRIFCEYGPIECIRVVCDPVTRESRGFGFVYFRNRRDALSARSHCDGLKFDGRRLRVDFSTTDRPHSPTPGLYMGSDRIKIERRRDSRTPRQERRSSLECDLFRLRRVQRRSPSPMVPFVHPRFRPLGSSSGTSDC
ncbi:transformer-2 protein homolog beta-like [Armigeres subalbatus]|uniref:transformer-2 protein homolog beta-like n=1 Tax=Armigeres subalbatus TaxID=124917 RepID=UPI002ECFC0A2